MAERSSFRSGVAKSRSLIQPFPSRVAISNFLPFTSTNPYGSKVFRMYKTVENSVTSGSNDWIVMFAVGSRLSVDNNAGSVGWAKRKQTGPLLSSSNFVSHVADLAVVDRARQATIANVDGCFIGPLLFWRLRFGCSFDPRLFELRIIALIFFLFFIVSFVLIQHQNERMNAFP